MSIPVIISRLATAAQIWDAASGTGPNFEDEAVVEVIGHPGANRRDLYYLGVAAAHGLVKRYGKVTGLLPPISLLMIEYDASDNWVRVTQKFEATWLEVAAAAGVAAAGASRPNLLNSPLFAGPAPELIGGQWEFAGARSPAPGGGPVPSLPFAGSTILTTDTTAPIIGPLGVPVGTVPPVDMNPKPEGDLRSRGPVVRGRNPAGRVLANGEWFGDLVSDLLVPLVFSALTNPGSTSQTVFPATNPATG